MIQIVKGGNVLTVTNGAYKDIYKAMGWEIFNSENPVHERRKEGRSVPIKSAEGATVKCIKDCTRCSQIAATCSLQPECKFDCTHCSQIAMTCPIRNDGDKALSAKPVESALADFPLQIQAEHNVPVEYETMDTAAKKEPDESVLVDIDTDAENVLIRAQYKAGLLLKYADKTDEWHFVSDTKHNGKGFADIARAELDQQVKDGKQKNYKQKDVDNLARRIERNVKTHRENLGITTE